jgi:hypothetical protein
VGRENHQRAGVSSIRPCIVGVYLPEVIVPGAPPPSDLVKGVIAHNVGGSSGLHNSIPRGSHKPATLQVQERGSPETHRGGDSEARLLQLRTRSRVTGRLSSFSS